MLARASASVRAELAWAPPRLRALLVRLLTEPVLSAQLVDEFVAAFFEVMLRLHAHASELVLSPLPNPTPADLPELLPTLRPLPRAALTRVAMTLAVLSDVAAAELGRIAISEIPAADIEAATHNDDASRLAPRAILLFLVGLEALRHQEAVARGRAVALILRADRDCHAFVAATAAAEPRLYVPWYFKDAEGADGVRAFASWSDDLLLEDVEWAASPAELQAWADIRASLNSERSLPAFP